MIGKSKFRQVLVVLFFMLNLRAASAQEMSLRAVYNALSGVMAPIWVAQDAGLFTKHGVNVDLKYLAATTAVQGMLGGGEEIGLVGNQGIDAKLEGADLIYVASGLPVFVFQIYGRAETKTLAATAAKPQNSAAKAATPASTGLVDRVKSFLKSLWTPNS